MKKQTIKLIALDLDGTLFNHSGVITPETKKVLKEASQKGITLVIATGRPYIGLPLSDLAELGISYAITTNGAAVYRTPQKEILLEEPMERAEILEVLRAIAPLPVHSDVFINGDGYTDAKKQSFIEKLSVPESLRHYIKTTRTVVPDLACYVSTCSHPVQKITINFIKEETGFLAKDTVAALLASHPSLQVVSGGYGNLELTQKGISKAKGLSFLCELLSIPPEQTMACGDSENDRDIVTTAHIGVAMANASDDLKACADYICPKTNEEDGVAFAIKELVSL